EYKGTYTIDLPRSTIETYLREARNIEASLLLHVQPGRASLPALVNRWEQRLAEPDVGILFDLRPERAFIEQRRELDDTARLVRAIGGEHTMVLVRGVHAPGSEVLV